MSSRDDSPVASAPVDDIGRAAAGDGDALARLFRLYHASVRRAAQRVTDCGDDADDVVQDVFVALPTALASYAEQGRFEAWLARLTVRTALMRRRAALRASARAERHADEDATSRTSTPAPDAVILARLTLADALDALPDSARAVVSLRELEGLTHDEIAERLGISRNASEVRLHRAFKQLRTFLDRSR